MIICRRTASDWSLIDAAVVALLAGDKCHGYMAVTRNTKSSSEFHWKQVDYSENHYRSNMPKSENYKNLLFPEQENQ